jgi:hypothetical protein
MLAGLQALLGGALSASAAPGDVIADVNTPPGNGAAWALGIAKAVAFDGQYLYYAEYNGTILHRLNMPPPGASAPTSSTDVPIVGIPGGVMTFAYDRGRNGFWTVSGDGTGIYAMGKDGSAWRVFTVNQGMLPGGCKTTPPCSQEVKIAYDRTDDTIWYSPDTTKRIYHFRTYGDLLGNAILIGYFDVDVAPNDMSMCPSGSYASGIAVGGTDLFIENSACNYYFEYSKTGTRVAAIARGFATSGGLACDNLTYAVSVIWMRNGWNSHIYAIEQPSANACAYGGG